MPRLTQEDLDVGMALAEHALRLTQPDLASRLEGVFADDRERRIAELENDLARLRRPDALDPRNVRVRTHHSEESTR